MPYVSRTDGVVTGVARWPSDVFSELLADDHADVVAYRDHVPPPTDVTFLQMLGAAVASEPPWFTAEEALAWARRETLPAALDAYVLALPAEAQPMARLKLFGMVRADRTDPMVDSLVAVFLPEATADERAQARDAFFALAATL